MDGTTPAAGQVVTLEVIPYPYKGWSPADTPTTNTTGAYTLTITAFQAKDYAPAGFPFPSRVRSAASYLSQRAGYTAFAVVDSEGRLSGQNIHRTFISASVVKAMLLVAYLRKLDAHHQSLDS